MVMVGVKVAKIFNTGLLWIPKSNFEIIPPYLFSLNRLLFYSLILSVFQLVASLYTLISFNSAKGIDNLKYNRCFPPCQLGPAVYFDWGTEFLLQELSGP